MISGSLRAARVSFPSQRAPHLSQFHRHALAKEQVRLATRATQMSLQNPMRAGGASFSLQRRLQSTSCRAPILAAAAFQGGSSTPNNYEEVVQNYPGGEAGMFEEQTVRMIPGKGSGTVSSVLKAPQVPLQLSGVWQDDYPSDELVTGISQTAR
jgi:hypothetical protein